MTREMWDDQAATFDDEPDHGLSDPTTRAAWRALLLDVLPPAPARVVDLGCGTGSLTRLLVDEGYAVEGLDFSPGMVDRARQKVPEGTFTVGDAAEPPYENDSYDVVLSRHVLWALPSPRDAFARWADLLRPGGRAVLVEGRWHTGAGLTADETQRIVRTVHADVAVRRLPDPALWGRPVDDERYLVVSRARPLRSEP